MYGKKNDGQYQKADEVLLKQELDYCTIGCLLHLQLRVEVACVREAADSRAIMRTHVRVRVGVL